MKTIMLATDFSERSDRALRRATLLAEQFNASLSIIHIVDDDQPKRLVEREKQIAENYLHQLEKTVTKMDGVTCTSEVIFGAPHDGIAQATNNASPDLLVVGPHRRQALHDVFVGTTAERTIRAVQCPVLMVNAPPLGHYRRVLLTTDLSESARATIERFLALGIPQKADCELLYVFDAPALHLAMSHTIGIDEKEAYIADEKENAAKDLADFTSTLGGEIFDQILRLAKQKPAQEILTVAQSQESDLIVVGTSGKGGIAKFFLGSVAEEVLRSADRDILAVPPGNAVQQAVGDDSGGSQ
ncbi:universal stress protein [Hoeflea prorocentri]|uniref:Universal stress protein n=1 Tax=Hoeflea prorocentri TaxID=1922333 RepID=A0A9X3UG72_9HYPH|nr:universal stress protein [Hoeflea prorocentri]MCY6380763.1 universal stress protein [Hoeflea prorocentri]MDA5398563.1 universal stress protein [Hoeflea prorocentri]